MERTRSVIGSPVRGGDLWDRESEIKRIWKTLEKDHILLVAPRRFGKTSLMLHLLDKPRDGYRVYYLDTEWISGPADFIAEFIAELLKDDKIARVFDQVGGLFKGVLNRIKEVGVMELFKVELRTEVAKNWQEKGKEFVSHLGDAEGSLVLLVDELPLMILRMIKENEKEAADFLHWFRAIRQMPKLSNVRFIIGGSIGIEHVLKKANTGTAVINDLHRIQVESFSNEEAREFIKVLLGNEAGLEVIPNNLLDKFMEVLEIPVPFFIQILVSESIREAEKQGKAPSAQIVEKAYYERVLASYNRTYFEHYYARLKDYYSSEDAKLTKALLLEIAKRKEMPRSELWNFYQNLAGGESDEEKFSYLLSDLENDFYIRFDHGSESYRFATKVLRDWWLRHYTILK